MKDPLAPVGTRTMVSASADTGVPPGWAAKVAGTLINPSTLLATDYLNHFNEVVMLLDMVPDMPDDMLPECKAWALKTYPEHFRTASLDYGPLAAEAYDYVPPATKIAFETTIDQLAIVIGMTVHRLETTLAHGNPEALRVIAKAGTSTMHVLIEQLGGIINGVNETLDQDQIDAMMSAGNTADSAGGKAADSAGNNKPADSAANNQAAIDALFD